MSGGNVRRFPRSTYSFAELQVSQPTYDEIARKLRAGGWDHAFVADDDVIDMHGIGLKRDPLPEDASAAPIVIAFCAVAAIGALLGGLVMAWLM